MFWQTISEVVDLDLGTDFESVARLWISEKKGIELWMSALLSSLGIMETKEWILLSGDTMDKSAGADEKVLKDAKRPEIDKPKRRCREVVGRFGKKFSTA
jgi:hypothetical protein